jgi:hypothetical protein
MIVGLLEALRLRLRTALCLCGRVLSALRLTASAQHRTRGTTSVVGTGSAVRPYPLLLRGVSARPIRRSRHPRRSKVFPSLARLGLATLPAWVVLFQECTGPMSDAPTDVPGHRDFRECPCNGDRGVVPEAGMSCYLDR